MNMTIKKGHLNLFLTVLGATTPKFVEARFRDKIIKQLRGEYMTYEADRIKICKELCKKDPEGEPDMVKALDDKQREISNFQFEGENLTKFNDEVKVLQNETIKINLEGDEQNRLIKLVESTNYQPKMGETEVVDSIINPPKEEKTKPNGKSKKA